MYNYLLPLILILFSSCQKKAYDEYYSFQNDEWHADSLVIFKHFVKDTIKPYDISLKIRHNVNYEFQNIFVFLQGEFTDTLELFLANKHGKWLGKGVSDIREKEYVFKKANVFSKKGEHVFIFEQAMRHGDLEKMEKLKNILDIGLIVTETDE